MIHADIGKQEWSLSPAVLALAQEVSDEQQRKRELGERSAEYHHRGAEDRDAVGHEQHVPELVDGGGDAAHDRDVAVRVVERGP